MLIATVSVFVSRPFQWTDLGKIHEDRPIHPYLPIFYIRSFRILPLSSLSTFITIVLNSVSGRLLASIFFSSSSEVFSYSFIWDLLLSLHFGCLSVFVSCIR